MNIFVTGINGVLGTELKERLRSRGHSIYGCGLTHSEDPQIVRADIREYRQLKNALDDVGELDIIYHLAGEFGRVNGEDFYEDLWSTNCVGTHNVIEQCIKRDTTLVFASSSEAYGLSEAYTDGFITEAMLDQYPPQFHSQYALSKYANERQILMAVRNRDLDAIILRFFNIYGPPERYSLYRSVVCQFIYQLLSGSPITVNREGKRTHLWIGDWARTMANIATEEVLNKLATNKYWPGSGGTPYVPVFNIGGTEYESVESLYDRLVDILGDTIPQPDVTYIESEAANTKAKRPDNSMAELWLNHRPSTLLDEGLRITVNWMRETYGF